MTEAEWLQCDDLHGMLRPLEQSLADRKWSLISLGVVRGIWPHLADPRSKKYVECFEGWLDGRISEGDLERAISDWTVAYDANTLEDQSDSDDTLYYLLAVGTTAIQSVATSAANAMGYFAASLEPEASRHSAWSRAATAERVRHAGIVRDILGLIPFRPPPALDPAWLRWRDATIPRLAQQMYDARDFASMPILADALEEAGCTSGDILDHCRGPGSHVRGCWLVDLILEKE